MDNQNTKGAVRLNTDPKQANLDACDVTYSAALGS